ncbi:hypothetical protein N9J56_00860 [Pelagibacteraceae bacterium]|nr:hypothetical protein [Pelagibacteraceae bacterium]
MLQINKKKLIILLAYVSFFIAIPIIKNETRLIEKKIQKYKTEIKILEKNLSEAYLEFEYLSSPEVLEEKVNRNIDINYDNLNISQIYLNFDDFINEQKKITKILINEK